MGVEFPREPALIPYFTAGYPSIESTEKIIETFEEGGADIIEVGLPFSEPIADGPVIQNAISSALENGMTTDRLFSILEGVDVSASLVIMTYYNLVFQRGVDRFVEECSEVGVDGLIIPDLPVEESGELLDACRRHDVDLIFIVAPTTDEDRIREIMDNVSGFVYVQARLGTTGVKEDVSSVTHSSLEKLDGYDIPKAVGFGVSSGEHAEEIIRGGADGVVAGSVFIEIMKDNDFYDELREKAEELKNGAMQGSR